MTIPFTDLNPRFIGDGVQFDCPCRSGACVPVFIPFAATAAHVEHDRPIWQGERTAFDVFTLRPSIRRMDNCRWHGFVTRGAVEHCSDWTRSAED